ncbi:MAG: hypothetical protein FWD55_06570 [Propionibacteriaceae bacterium]|nr:hypothetical protein [Propionibacteriaceae bacterium]
MTGSVEGVLGAFSAGLGRLANGGTVGSVGSHERRGAGSGATLLAGACQE